MPLQAKRAQRMQSRRLVGEASYGRNHKEGRNTRSTRGPRKYSCASCVPSLRVHEFGKIFNTVGDLVVRQAIHEQLSVTFRTEPVIQYRENSSIRSRSQQTSKALLQPQNRVRYLIFRKRISARPLDLRRSRSDERVRGHLKRQLI